MKCLRIAHVNLRVARIDEAIRFYGEVLGLGQIKRGETQGNGAWFSMGEQEIHLTEDSAPEPVSNRHFAVIVEDLAAARRSVTEGGAKIEKEESWRFWTRDPSGNRIELMARGR